MVSKIEKRRHYTCINIKVENIFDQQMGTKDFVAEDFTALFQRLPDQSNPLCAD